ncbi:hypothetical protein VF04_04330 [Nostoc linckia z7]|uniref:GIY-YIG domain-containing protein n=2 Tax=Nostoc linckia TaxID=92942 RepID=A0A9Q5ZG38_NOSLI|nr:GIY-YIG nuclease family protein [Nostoc linckia]PHK42939.1 hypothetical protein VF12_01030 [Nostoc linckia z15]PHK48096.1 hypothetical protein VF13_02005 [Nostoc linckia z16]PHJ65016.1 hypothetical protein VF02_11815 [Nostoc linckia z1]PHJ70194.1 hypothetical protein VF05_11975 [Nostoc linckia z3]PHJ75095.1 hypothetical protein VF03_12135 [Nostoc linckia z2]
MNTTTYIYVLADPRDGSIFYVGRTTMSLNRRLHTHIRDGKKQRTEKGKYIAQMLAVGVRPQIREVELVTNATREEAIAKEEAWQQFYSITNTLTNKGSAVFGGHGTNKRVVWTPETINLLGKQTDTYIAELLGCDRKSVEYKREKLKIPRCLQTNFVVPAMGGWNKIELSETIIEQLGKMPDYALVKQAGVSKTVISNKRVQLNIPSYAATTGNNGRWGKRIKPKIFLSPNCKICKSINTIRYGSGHRCKDCLSQFSINVERTKSKHICVFCDSSEVYQAARSGKNKNLLQCDNCLQSFRIGN